MIQSIAVCGAGTMGCGIAQVSAMAGYKTILFDANETAITKSRKTIQTSLTLLTQKGKITNVQANEYLQAITFTNHIQECTAQLIIEAIIEDWDIKTTLLQQLAAINGNNTIYATNTSSLSVTRIAENFSFPQQVIGIHFFNPPVLMQLVEVVQTSYTLPAITSAIKEMIIQMKKTPVICKDAPGFIVNHVARTYYLEALRLVENGLASIEEIDLLLENTGFKMGPFRLMDLIGNDINYAVSCSVYEQLGAPERLIPSTLQKEKVQAGQLGRKTGQGYYSYTDNK